MSDRTPVIQELLATSLRCAADVAQTRVGKPLQVVEAGAPESSALLRFDLRFEGGATISWFVSNEDATGFSDMLIGGAGDRGAVLTEMHLDALSGVFSDMLERSVDGLSAGLSSPISAGGVDMGMEGMLPAPDAGGLRVILGYDIEGFGVLTIVAQADPAMVALLERSGPAEGAAPAAPTATATDAPAPAAGSLAAGEGAQGESAPAATHAAPPAAGGAAPASAGFDNVVQLPNLTDRADGQRSASDLGMLLNVPLQLTVELGRTERTVREVLELSVGSIIELSKLAGDPMDIMVNGKVLARGEVVVIDEEFGVRITDILTPEQRLRNMG